MASKGKKKPSLFTLSRQPLVTEEERTAYWRSLETESDRSVAIRGSAFVEHALFDLLVEAMREMGEEDIEHLFIRANAPLGTFAARTDVARAFDLITDEHKHNLDIIRHLRNTFAHAVINIDFSFDIVDAKCSELTVNSASTLSRHKYIVACITIANDLLEKRIAIRIKKVRGLKEQAENLLLKTLNEL